MITSNGVVSGPDPYFIDETGSGSFQCWRRTNNKTLVGASLDPAKRTCVLLVLGQSNVSNLNPAPYFSSNAGSIINFNIYDGGAYQAVGGSLLGCTNAQPSSEFGNPVLRLADKLIDSKKFDVVWLLTPAVGGTTVFDWDVGSCSTRVDVMIKRMRSQGIDPSVITAVLWGIGETDNAIETSTEAWRESMMSIVAKSRGLGVAAPQFIARQTWNAGATSAAVRSAQVSVIDHSAGIWAGPDSDVLGADKRQPDNVHFNDAGAEAYASLWHAALKEYGSPF